jgi:hypothetical protein
MAEKQETDSQTQFLLMDFNTRLRDIDEKNKLIRERVLLLGKNLITSKQEVEEELKEIKKENLEIKKDLEKIKKITGRLISEFNKFVERKELILIERMLKDFQPLEFMRKKDVEELIENKLSGNTPQPKIKTHKEELVKSKPNNNNPKLKAKDPEKLIEHKLSNNIPRPKIKKLKTKKQIKTMETID